jgi:hypothetical protein
MATWYILWSFWYIFPRFGILYQEKSGNPAGSLFSGSLLYFFLRSLGKPPMQKNPKTHFWCGSGLPDGRHICVPKNTNFCKFLNSLEC